MLFFARTTASGDIEEYLLIMRAEGDDVDTGVYLEINEQLLAGHDLMHEVRLTGNIVTLVLHEASEALGGAAEVVLTFDDSEENRTSMEAGAFRVLGDLLAGGNA